MTVPTKILVVEDNLLTLKILNFILKKEGYSVSNAVNGLEAMQLIDELQPDLVVTDVVLPLKSGLEVISYSKDHLPQVPVIVLSGLGEEERTVTKAFQLGADDFVAKPFNPNEFILRISRLLLKTEVRIAI